MSENPGAARRQANAEKDLAALNQELAREMKRAAAAATEMIDPAPVIDGIDAALRLAEHDLVGAGLSLLSLVPSLAGASEKDARATARIAKLRKKIAAAAAELEALR